MSRCTNPIGVRLFVDVPNKVVILYKECLSMQASTKFSDDFDIDDHFVSSAAQERSAAEIEQREKQRAIKGE